MGEFRNYYEIVPKKYIDEPIEYASSKEIQIVLPAMIGIVGGTGSGKTNILMNLIHDLNAFTKIFIFARDIEETFYQWIIDRLTISGKKVGKELLQYSNSLAQLPPVTTIQGTKGKKEWDSILMIFDDMITAGTKDMTKMVDYFIAARKKKCTCVFLSQNYFEIPAMIRTNCHYFFFTKLRSSQDCARVLNDFQGLDIHVDENLGSTEASKQKGKWMKIIYQLASHNETFGHALMIDCKAPKGSPLQFREKYTPLVHLYPQLIPILTPNLGSKDEKKEDEDDDKEEEDNDGEDDDDGSQSDVDGTPAQENARLKQRRAGGHGKSKGGGKRQRYRASPYKVRIPRARDDLDPNLRPYNKEKAHKQRVRKHHTLPGQFLPT